MDCHSGNKLDTNCMTTATASVLFHKFQKATKEDEYDNYVSTMIIWIPDWGVVQYANGFEKLFDQVVWISDAILIPDKISE